jgi:hypothetical protein
MYDTSPSTQFEEWVRAAIVSRLARPDPIAILALRSDLMARATLSHAGARFGNARLAFALGVLVVLIACGMFIASPQAAAAVRHWLGFIPGVGLVDERGSWQVLAGPVSQTRRGVELTVESGSSDSGRTILFIRVDGLQPPLGAPGMGDPDGCGGTPELLVADEAMQGMGQHKETWGSGYTYRLVFPPMPAGTTEAELHIPCLLQVVRGAWPRDWVVPLEFRPGEGYPFEPAYEPRLAIESGTETQAPGAGTASPGPTPWATRSSLIKDLGISSSLDGVVHQTDGITLFGSTTWTAPSIFDYGVGVLPLAVSLTDADGRGIRIEPAAPDDLPAPGDQRTAWAYHASETDVSEPMTLTFSSFLVDLSASGSINLELGPDPQPDQTLIVDRRIDLGEFDVTIVSADLTPGDAGGTDLTLTLRSDSGVVGALIYDREHPQSGGGGGGGMPQAGQEFTASLTYPDGIHRGQIHLSIDRVTVLIDETSTLTWAE